MLHKNLQSGGFPKFLNSLFVGNMGQNIAQNLLGNGWISYYFLLVLAPGKPSVDPATAKLWTLSANDMNDEEMVSIFICETSLSFLLSSILSYSN